MKYKRLLFLSLAILIPLAGCSSDNNRSPNEPLADNTSDSVDPSIPDDMPDEVVMAFDPNADLQDVTATFSPASPFLRTSTVDISSYNTDSGHHAFRPLVFTSDGDSSKLLVKHFNPSDKYNYFTWDTATNSISESFAYPDDVYLTFSDDGSTAYYQKDCLPSVLKPGESLSSMSLASILPPDMPDDRCVVSSYVSANGGTALFGAMPSYTGPPIAGNGTSAPGYNRDLLIYKNASGSILDLNATNMPLNDARFDQLIRHHNDWSISEDGSVAAASFQFLPDTLGDGNIRGYYTTPIVVDTNTGAATIVDVRHYNTDLCSKCRRVTPDDIHLSADGKSLWYLQVADTVNGRVESYSSLYHYDVATGEVTEFDRDNRIDTLSLSDSGRQVAYLTQGSESSIHRQIVVLDFDTGNRIVVDNRALRGCVGDVCEFESVRFIRRNPLDLSADGSTMLISAIGSRADIAEPQNINELFLLDIATNSVSRLLPDTSVDEYGVSDDGQHVALEIAYKAQGTEALDAGFYVLHRN